MGKKIERVVRPKLRVPSVKSKVDMAGALDSAIKERQPDLKELKRELLVHAGKYNAGTLIGYKYIATTGPMSSSDADLDVVWDDILHEVELKVSTAQHEKLDAAFEILKALVSPDTAALRKYYSRDEDAILLSRVVKIYKKDHGKITFKEI